MGDLILVEQEYAKHKEAMREGDAAAVEMALAVGKQRFKKAEPKEQADG